MITLCIRYTIDARKGAEFERYAETVSKIIARCGGGVVGYWVPTKFAGPTNFAVSLIDFPNLGAYEAYRERLGADAEFKAAAQRADECILVEDRAIMKRAG